MKAKKSMKKNQNLDSRVTEMINEGFKIKKREDRKNIIQLCKAFKDKLFTVTE